jgi:hypothetical protein
MLRAKFQARSVRRLVLLLLTSFVATAILAGLHGRGSAGFMLGAQTPGPCDPPNSNAVVCENQLPGNPESEWDITGAGDSTIQGFATDISVNRGQTISFKINTPSANYQLNIYRIGYYGGLGGRKMATVVPSAHLPQTQPACLNDAATGMADCGNWGVSASWTVPANATSGVYVVNVKRIDTGGASHIIFVVRDDARQAGAIMQTSDTTWQAYNQYGGASLYCGGPVSNAGTSYGCGTRAAKVSYNRPITTRATAPDNAFFTTEYPMVRWLEANGYDVKYWAGVDTDRRGADLTGAVKPKVFLSVGHDEYWSGNQRTAVENARNAGVNLAFFSGNEMYWKTRYEASIDGSNTAFRTLVSYKETLAAAKIDPAVDQAGKPIWTGTWRDPRFSPPADGGRPENGLKGSIWTVNSGSAAITVPAEMAGLRFWRNTSVAALTSGVATLTDQSLGYEWNEDLDNGFRPAGVVHLSSTTVNNVSKIIDYGANVGNGTATHNLTLYRHSSGALVFGAGTVQWTWGLDNDHDGTAPPPDPAMQQSTVNLLADMQLQPLTLQPGLTPATASSDTVPPVSAITSPPANASFGANTVATITGTAADTGGQVAGVDVSVDGGLTWRHATGLTRWSYGWLANVVGPTTILSRATDDSGNVERPTSSVAITVSPATCPCTIWPPAATPAQIATTDTNPIEVGLRFRADTNGVISGLRFYKGAGNTGTHIGNLWTATGTLLASATFANETTSGWQQVGFASPVTITANTTYVASYHTTAGNYAHDDDYFLSTGVDTPPLHALSNGVAGGNGVFAYGGTGFPTQSFNANNYWVDVVFAQTAGPPTIISASPSSGATGVNSTASVMVGFSAPMDPATITTTTFVLRDPANAVVASTVGYSTTTHVATLLPSQKLAASTTYTVTVSGGSGGVKDAGGTAMVNTSTWSFTTRAPQVCPCTIWPASATPAQIATSDTGALEVGVQFTADTTGTITGLRFYKGAGNTGTHVGNLWTAAGTLLATATFGNETPSGWQQVAFGSPVTISANTTYVASYHTNVGNYGHDDASFVATGVDNPPLHALSNGVAGGNGLYVYAATTAFPTQTFNATNYWVDVVFMPSVGPAIASLSPAAGSTGVSTGAPVTATFSVPMDPATITSATIVLRDPSNAIVGGTVSYNSSASIATLSPSQPLAALTTYTATVVGGSSGVKDLNGNALPSSSAWSFTTGGVLGCPCSTIWPPSATPAQLATNDTGAIEVGVRFTADANGVIAGLRFYKGAGNTGAHIGNLWTAAGALMATATFTNETASGWQQVGFASPVSINANTTYVASYHTTIGNYGYDSAYFAATGVDNTPLHALSNGVAGGNGVYAYGPTGFPAQSYNATNYWVDVLFAPVGPTITSRSPASGATAVSSSAPVTATFNEAMDPSTITNTTFVLRDPANALVATTVSYNATTKTATLVPSQPLGTFTAYTAAVIGGSSGVKDASGVALNSTSTWSFTTAGASIWLTTVAPTQFATTDTSAVEVGVQFTADTNGKIAGVRFYKGAGNTGTHTGSLWTATGALLATATFTNETASGWQQAAFAAPVAITANTTYVASYHTTVGNYAYNGAYFAAAGVDNPPLHALANGAAGGNGRYVYGPTAFPTGTYNATNYWVDVVFVK